MHACRNASYTEACDMQSHSIEADNGGIMKEDRVALVGR